MAQKITEQMTVKDFYDYFKEPLQLELASGGKGMANLISEVSLNRPALAITGYFKNFAASRIQLFGAGEMAYLRDQTPEKQAKIMRSIVEKDVPCMIVSRNVIPTKSMLEVSEEASVPLLRTRMKSKEFSTDLAVGIERKFAPKIALHGTFLDVKGIGVLIRGESGVGKSECALALVDHGHSLVADDMTYCVRIRKDLVIGRSNDLNRGYMECRGIGIIDISKLYGIRSLRVEKQLDLVISFKEWKPGMVEERTGLEQNYYDVLGVSIPHIEIPVRPGRDMARLVEVAAMVQALRSIGHDAAAEFNQKLIAAMS